MTFSTIPVVCLTLAKWETVSGQFGGYLNGVGRETFGTTAAGSVQNLSHFRFG